jgi:hypothetical protein
MRLAMTRHATPPSGRPNTPRRLSELSTHAWFWMVLVPYLGATLLLLATVFALNPHRAGDPRAPAGTWDYQRELVAVDGGGAGNAYARGAIRAAAGMAKGSIERQRDVFRLNLLDFLVGRSLAGDLGAWRDTWRLPLQGATTVLLAALIAYGVLRRPARRVWLVAALMLIAATLVVTRPYTTTRLAAAPGVAVPGMTTTVAAVMRLDGERVDPDQVRERLAGRYWTEFVAYPLSRLQSGGTTLAESPPAGKAGVLELLRRRVAGVNDWAIGRHGPERALIASSATLYVLPFALLLGVLAMVATCAQALLYLLCLAALVVLPLAAEPRWRHAILTWWLLPLAAAATLLAGASLASLSVLWLGQLVHAADEQLSLLVAGSIGPLAAAVLASRWLRRARRERRVALGGA